MKIGDWVELSDGKTAIVRSWDVVAGLARAELPSGGDIEMPIPYAEQRWRPLPEDGLRVRLALDEADIRRRARESPVDLVIFALRDCGGEADIDAIRGALTPSVMSPSEFGPWWQRIQPHLGKDPHLDLSRVRRHIYRLRLDSDTVADDMPASEPLKPPVDKTKRGRDGRLLADARQLRRARERARRGGPYSLDDEALFKTEIALAYGQEVDPTDRFMAAELGVLLGRLTTQKAIQTLGDDLLLVDLLRIPEKASRVTALRWLERSLEGRRNDDLATQPIVWSALAAGKPWSERALQLVTGKAPRVEDAFEGVLGWPVPGDRQEAEATRPDDPRAFARRMELAVAMAKETNEAGLMALWRGALHALARLAEARRIDEPRVKLLEQLGTYAWGLYRRLRGQRLDLTQMRQLPPAALRALISTAGQGEFAVLRSAVVDAYRREPSRYRETARDLAERLREDELDIGLAAARSEIARTTLKQIAEQLISGAGAGRRADATAGACVSLAVAVASESPQVREQLDRLGEAMAAELVDAGQVRSGPVAFSTTGWGRFARRINRALRAADERARAADERARAADERLAAADSEIARLQEIVRARSAELVEARTQTEASRRESIGRLAASLLKPVALALADSFEGDSLEALRDRLLVVLERAKIHPVVEVGAVVDFDPVRHHWVGEGPPTRRVRALSPGFLVRAEGEDDVVLVPARVVAPSDGLS